MHLYYLMPIIALWQSAQAGVFFTEEEYRDLADVVVIAEVVEADCLNVTESDTVRITDYQATLLVQNTTKGTIDGDRILLVSSTYDYGDEMDCSDPGSVHPVGEIATYHLKETDTAGTYTNIDAGSTFKQTRAPQTRHPSAMKTHPTLPITRLNPAPSYHQCMCLGCGFPFRSDWLDCGARVPSTPHADAEFSLA